MWHSFSRSFPNLLTKADAHVLSFTDKTTLSLETVAGTAPYVINTIVLGGLSMNSYNSTWLHHWFELECECFRKCFWSLFCNFSIINYILYTLPGWFRVYMLQLRWFLCYMLIFVQWYFSTVCWYCEMICIFQNAIRLINCLAYIISIHCFNSILMS